MAWKKYFKDANLSPLSGEKVPNFAKRNYSSYLPDVYTGHPNRIQRYFQYDQMDSDSEINACLLYTSPSPRDVEESRMPSSA